MIWVAIAAMVVTAAIVVVVTCRNLSETIVLGQQVADTRANEAARLGSGNVGPSPMPSGEYDQEAGDYDFASVTERPLDRELRALVQHLRLGRLKGVPRVGMASAWTSSTHSFISPSDPRSLHSENNRLADAKMAWSPTR